MSETRDLSRHDQRYDHICANSAIRPCLHPTCAPPRVPGAPQFTGLFEYIIRQYIFAVPCRALHQSSPAPCKASGLQLWLREYLFSRGAAPH